MSRLCFTEVILLTCVTEPFFFAEQTISTDDCERHKHPVITESTGHYQCNYRGRMFSNTGGIASGEGRPKNTHQLPVVCVFSRVQLFETPWTVACQAPPSMEFSRQEYWSALPFPSPGILNPGFLHCRQTLYPLSHKGSPDDKETSLVAQTL